MSTHEQDDYLICREYKEQIHQKSTEYPGFITFQHENGNHYFAWVNNDEIVLRSEAYPDAEKMERGIKAILKNWDLTERYSVDEEHGAHFLVLWGGGDEQHTGNRPDHSEIGRSCPHKSKEELHQLLLFKGEAFAQKVVPISAQGTSATTLTKATTETVVPVAATVAAAAAVVTPLVAAASANTHASATTSTTTQHTDHAAAAHTHASVGDIDTPAAGGMFRWLLPILALAALSALAWYAIKGCDDKKAGAVTDHATDASKKATNVVVATKPAYDSVNNIAVYDEGAKNTLKLKDGVVLDSIGVNSFENKLVDFINNGKIDTSNKKANWIDLSGVNFITNKTDYVGNSAMRVANAGKILKANPTVEIKIGGHTDKSGIAANNKVLSQQRADKVKADLIAAGATVSQIKEAVGYGGEFATADVSDKAGMAKDRKVAVKVSKQ